MDFHREKLKLPQSGQTQPIKLQFLKTCRNSQENDWFKKKLHYFIQSEILFLT